ncbi:cytochrome c oxidase subunit 3 [Vicingaceae bacterium]|jgi:cytochrome c oxidase subunit III|nr:cytochrome c oxidase subunit 3 [Vicingaceae bacterium]
MSTITLENTNYKDELKRKNSKPLLWIALVSIIMFFGGITSAVIVSQGGGSFISIPMPLGFTISTFIIVLSSITFHFGFISIKKGNYGVATISIGLTLLLGLLFVITQYSGWVTLHDSGFYLAGSESTQESSFLYLITGLHVVHLIGGLVSLIVVLVKTFKKKYNLEDTVGMQVSLTYWHFLGGLWIYLFFFLRYSIA